MATKLSEKAVAASPQRHPDAPTYVARARQEKNSRYFTNIGSGWKKQDKNGRDLVSVKLTSIPLNWDGSFVLVEPFSEDGEVE